MIGNSKIDSDLLNIKVSGNQSGSEVLVASGLVANGALITNKTSPQPPQWTGKVPIRGGAHNYGSISPSQSVYLENLGDLWVGGPGTQPFFEMDCQIVTTDTVSVDLPILTIDCHNNAGSLVHVASGMTRGGVFVTNTGEAKVKVTNGGDTTLGKLVPTRTVFFAHPGELWIHGYQTTPCFMVTCQIVTADKMREGEALPLITILGDALGSQVQVASGLVKGRVLVTNIGHVTVPVTNGGGVKFGDVDPNGSVYFVNKGELWVGGTHPSFNVTCLIDLQG